MKIKFLNTYIKRSLGAQTATVDKPPITPAVYLISDKYDKGDNSVLKGENQVLNTYHAARIMIGPPTNDNGAKIAPLNIK